MVQAVKPNWHNRTLFQGDNLEFMRSMNSGSVHLIATDPPFNKGKDFHATPESLAGGASFDDRWSWDEVRETWVDSIQDDHPAAWAVIDWTRMTYGDDMGAFLCFMAARLIEMRRVLRDNGSIYLHCDPTASHYLKALMDAIFGRKQFRNDIVWKRTSGRSDARRYGRVHDIILYYVKDGAAVWNTQYLPHDEEYVRRTYQHEDERGRWRLSDLTAAGIRNGESGMAWRGVDPGARGRHWATPIVGGMNDYIREHGLIPGWPEAYPGSIGRLEALDAAGLVYWPQRGARVPQLKRYLSSTKGIATEDVIDDVKRLEAGSVERTGYPTQKPLALYRRFIRASSNPGDIVFDPFAGCATTCVAAEAEGRQWVAADLWPGTFEVTRERLETLDRPADTGETSGLKLYPVIQRTDPLVRTDDGEVSAPALKSVSRKRAAPTMKREELLAALIERDGLQCQGCGFKPPHKGHLEIDHNRPRSDGGSNELDNRVLLCGPCNRAKSNMLTLSGLRRQNKRDGLLIED